MEKLVSVKAKRIEDSRKQSRRKGKDKLAIAFGNGVGQAQDIDVDPPQFELLDLTLQEKALHLKNVSLFIKRPSS
jgi:hypothetical protein